MATILRLLRLPLGWFNSSSDETRTAAELIRLACLASPSTEFAALPALPTIVVLGSRDSGKSSIFDPALRLRGIMPTKHGENTTVRPVQVVVTANPDILRGLALEATAGVLPDGRSSARVSNPSGLKLYIKEPSAAGAAQVTSWPVEAAFDGVVAEKLANMTRAGLPADDHITIT